MTDTHASTGDHDGRDDDARRTGDDGPDAADHDRDRRELREIDALLDDCAASHARAGAEDARLIRFLAQAWDLAQRQMARCRSADTARREIPLRSLAAQIAVELRMSDRTVQGQMHDAHRLVEDHPATLAALEAGRIDRRHVGVVLEEGARITEPRAREAFERLVLEFAERESPGKTRAFARRVADQVDPIPMQARHDVAAQGRSVFVVDREDGMSDLVAHLPTCLAHGIADRLSRQARALRDHARREAAPGQATAGPGAPRPTTASADLPATPRVVDQRTVDQTRADLLCDLLLTGAPAVDPTTGDSLPGGLGAITAHVQITVPVTTLAEVTPGGAELDGVAPVDADTARHLAGGNPVWERVMTHPVTATVVAVDRYRPSPAQQRFLQARDVTCRWPGCRTPARRCQIDHNHERHDGGPTHLGNLAHFCVRHHTLKTETDWTVSQQSDGVLRFTTPTGRDHTRLAPTRVAFVPDPPPF